jgi:hypothetical protein
VFILRTLVEIWFSYKDLDDACLHSAILVMYSRDHSPMISIYPENLLFTVVDFDWTWSCKGVGGRGHLARNIFP